MLFLLPFPCEDTCKFSEHVRQARTFLIKNIIGRAHCVLFHVDQVETSFKDKSKLLVMIFKSLGKCLPKIWGRPITIFSRIDFFSLTQIINV